MNTNALKNRSLLTLLDFSPVEISTLLELAFEVKLQSYNGEVQQRFLGMSIALLFEKRSTRTRCSFETAFGEEGGHPVFLSTQDIHLGAKESIEDTARVFGRMFDAIQFRGYKQETAEILAKYSGVPVYNGLTDRYHPTQALADLMTIRERFGRLEGVSLCFLGDGRNNVARSLIVGCSKTGVHLTIAAPEQLHPDGEILEKTQSAAAESGAEISLVTDPAKAVEGADILYTDVWASMGEESKREERRALLSPYQVNGSMMARTGNPATIFMHDLPAVKGEEVTADVIDGEASAAWDQAENRKHTIKALMLATLT